MDGLRVEILQSKATGNCSDNGISARYKYVTLTGLQGDGDYKDSPDAPSVHIRVREVWGVRYMTAYPEKPAKEGNYYSPGGCFIYTDDSRFPSNHPVPLHDKQEKRI